MDVKRIRCSMLPGYTDCARRSFAKQFRQLVTAAGFELRELSPSIGAAVGTAVHKAAEIMLLAIRDGRTPSVTEGVEAAMQAFRDETQNGAEYDDTTPNRRAAEAQILSLARAYVPMLSNSRPAAVEMSLRASLGGGWELTGHIDLYTEDGIVDDLKTGALPRPYQAQLGGYSLLMRSSGYAVSALSTTWIPRVSTRKPQPPATRTEFPIGVCERTAYATINAIRRDAEAFEETGDPYVIPANPMSLMCSPKYCPAHGTPFCRLAITTQRGDS